MWQFPLKARRYYLLFFARKNSGICWCLYFLKDLPNRNARKGGVWVEWTPMRQAKRRSHIPLHLLCCAGYYIRSYWYKSHILFYRHPTPARPARRREKLSFDLPSAIPPFLKMYIIWCLHPIRQLFFTKVNADYKKIKKIFQPLQYTTNFFLFQVFSKRFELCFWEFRFEILKDLKKETKRWSSFRLFLI